MYRHNRIGKFPVCDPDTAMNAVVTTPTAGTLTTLKPFTVLGAGKDGQINMRYNAGASSLASAATLSFAVALPPLETLNYRDIVQALMVDAHGVCLSEAASVLTGLFFTGYFDGASPVGGFSTSANNITNYVFLPSRINSANISSPARYGFIDQYVINPFMNGAVPVDKYIAFGFCLFNQSAGNVLPNNSTICMNARYALEELNTLDKAR